MNEKLQEQLQQLPQQPGVYLMKNNMGEVIYIGKAKSLKKRVKSYFRKGNHTYKTQILVRRIEDFDYIVTDTEVEAYILEANLIKKNQPKYNVRLKDDKSYPYIKITTQEDFPRIFKTRLVKQDGSSYYGPFANVEAIYKTINLLKDLFSLRTCNKEIMAGEPEDRPCLNFYINKCQGPCIGAISKEEYRELVDKVELFLQGHQQQLRDNVEEMMKKASDRRNFEKAARYRDALQAFDKISRQQKVMSDKNIDQDVIALIKGEESTTCVQLLIIRNGRLIGQEYFMMEGCQQQDRQQIMASFLQQYYERAPQIPDELLLNVKISDKQLLLDSLRQKKGKKVPIINPRRGNKKRLVAMAEQNARENLKKEEIKARYQEKSTSEAVRKLKKELDLPDLPTRIEGFDISNIQGTDPVASMVVFENGKASKKDYRRFKIKTVTGVDDYAMMQEVIQRRYSRLLKEERALPDLILIDGGKGQLNAAVEILEELGLEEQMILGLAKKEEEVFLPDRSQPVSISSHSPALHLLQRVRDEAHRFAVNYHRKLRSRRLTHSMLDNIPGVGPKRRQSLLRHFGSLGKIKQANISQLKQAEGISSKTARKIYDFLREHTRAY